MQGVLYQSPNEVENGESVMMELAPVPKYSGPLKIKTNKLTTTAAVSPAAKEPDIVVDLAHTIENLKKDEAIIWLGELEDAHEQTYFEIGGLLSVIQKNDWFDPYASFDEWVEKSTAMRRSKARVLVQVYDAIVNSGVTWAKVEHIGWTKLRGIARILKAENADYWIEFASDHTKREIIEQVRQELASAGTPNASGSGWQTRAFKLHVDQVGTVDAAVEKMKLISETKSDSVALELICKEYVAGQSLEQNQPHLSASALEAVITNLFGQYEKGVVKNILKSALAKFDGAPELASN